MKRLAIVCCSVLLLFAMSACSRTKVLPLDEAPMSAVNFVNQSVTVQAGKPVKFSVYPDGATHILVMGTNGLWKDTPNSPKELNSSQGITIQPGEKRDIIFPTAGIYTVTCTIHQSMLLTVTVTP